MIYRNDEISEAYSLIKDVDPSTPQVCVCFSGKYTFSVHSLTTYREPQSRHVLGMGYHGLVWPYKIRLGIHQHFCCVLYVCSHIRYAIEQIHVRSSQFDRERHCSKHALEIFALYYHGRAWPLRIRLTMRQRLCLYMPVIHVKSSTPLVGSSSPLGTELPKQYTEQEYGNRCVWVSISESCAAPF